MFTDCLKKRTMLTLKEKLNVYFRRIFRSKDTFAVLIVFCAVLLSYINIINGDFIYDDKNFIVDNKPIKTWLFSNPWDFFLKPEVAVWSGIYRPLRTLSFAIDYQLFGLNSAGYHIENLIWHLANCLLVYFLIKKFFRQQSISFFATLIFSVHPVQIESVTWISSRGDLMFLFFTLVCFHFYLKFHRNLSFLKIIIWNTVFIIALLSKETAIALLPLIFIYDYLFSYKNSDSGFWKFIKSRRMFYTSVFLTAITYLTVRFSLFENASQKSFWGGSAESNFMTMIDATVYYFRLIFYPVGLSLDYSTYPITYSLADRYLILDLIFYICVTALLIIQYRRKNYLFLFFCSVFVLFLLPSWNILPISAIIAERFLYAPMIGFSTITGLALHKLFKAEKFKKIALISACFIPVTLIILSAYRNRDWESDFSIWKSCVDRFPGNFKGHINLGTCYDTRGNVIAAITEYYKLIAVAPHHAMAYYNLGNLYWGLGIFEKSRWAYLTAIKLNPQYWEAYNNLGSLYVEKQWYKEAEKCFLKVIVNEPNHMKAHFNLASLYVNFFKDYDKAMYHIKILKQDSDYKNNPIVNNLFTEINRQRYIKSLNLSPDQKK